MARQAKTAQLLATFKSRTVSVFVGIAVVYLLLAGRLVYLQAARHTYFQKEADSYRVSKSLLPAHRGILYDRNGDALAINVPAWAVFADPQLIKNPAETAATLAPLLGEPVDRMTRLLTPRSKRSRFVSLKRHAPIEMGQRVKAENILGIGVLPDTRRSYPNQDLASQLIGFTDRDGNGIEGIERSQETLLSGKDGIEVAEIDREGRFLPGTERHRREPVNGHDLYLTIDRTLQHAADTELAQAVTSHHAKRGIVVVLDPKTGEILALSNAPGYNPNQPRPAGPLTKDQALLVQSYWRDTAVSDLYEPGSTLKTITAAALIQDKGPDILGVHVHCSGQMKVGKHTIHCAPDPPYYGVHGDETLREVLEQSCNIGIAQLAFRLGPEKLYEYEQKFGFLDPPSSGLPGERKSPLQSPANFNQFTGATGWSKIQLANIAFGQGIAVSPLQLASAYGAIANDGMLMRPHILRAVDQKGQMEPVAPETVRQVLSPETAATVRSLLGSVVQNGTGKAAQIAGFSVGGKTGSAQVSGAHGYEAGHYVASFIGMVPLSKPRLVILCAVYEPQGVHWGAAVAAPVVHNIAKVAMLQMHVEPDSPDAIDWDDHLKVRRHKGKLETGLTSRTGQIKQL